MVLHLLTANAEHWPRPPTQHHLADPDEYRATVRNLLQAGSTPATPQPHRAPQPTHLSHDHFEPLTLGADQHPSHPTSLRPPAHHHIMISIQQSPQPFRMSEDSGCGALPHFSYCHFP
ncbi:MAG TPA: hypothetical protein VE196_10975 [Pseudonocardiaceae bacterium]|nr:hypothetical protein [Pseudonocardiaceae bacterium]